MVLSEITPGRVQEYRMQRTSKRKDRRTGEQKRPARNTIHQEIVALRHVLKAAHRHGWLPHLPDLSAPYKSSGKVSHRAWFSADEYKRLYQATRERAKHPKKERWRRVCENLHDYVLFMVNTGLRPDECSRLELRDVAIVTDEATENASWKSKCAANAVSAIARACQARSFRSSGQKGATIFNQRTRHLAGYKRNCSTLSWAS